MPWLSLIILVLIIPLIPTAYAGLIGAPWVPSRRKAVDKAMQELGIGSKDTVIDLGAGSGTIVLSAAARGAKALGYELSPFMWLAAKARVAINNLTPLRPFGGFEGQAMQQFNNRSSQILLRNFYHQTLPSQTTVVFAFLMPDNMPRLRHYLTSQNLPNLKYILAYTFPFKEFPPKGVIKTPNCGNIYIYDPAILKQGQ